MDASHPASSERSLTYCDRQETVEEQDSQNEIQLKYELRRVSLVGYAAERESKKGRMADALAHGGDEGRDKLR